MTSRSRLWLASGVVAVAVSVVAVTTTGIFAGNRATGGQEGADVPFEYYDGTRGNLSDFAGRPVVVNFWASWCAPCVAEMPDFEQVHARLGDQVVFLGLNMQETDPTAAEELIARTGVTYLLGRDRDGSIFADFGGIAMPTTVLLDEEGTVVSVHAGAIFAEDLEALIRRELLET